MYRVTSYITELLTSDPEGTEGNSGVISGVLEYKD